jgi:hypothetical protein
MQKQWAQKQWVQNEPRGLNDWGTLRGHGWLRGPIVASVRTSPP